MQLLVTAHASDRLWCRYPATLLVAKLHVMITGKKSRRADQDMGVKPARKLPSLKCTSPARLAQTVSSTTILTKSPYIQLQHDWRMPAGSTLLGYRRVAVPHPAGPMNRAHTNKLAIPKHLSKQAWTLGVQRLTSCLACRARMKRALLVGGRCRRSSGTKWPSGECGWSTNSAGRTPPESGRPALPACGSGQLLYIRNPGPVFVTYIYSFAAACQPSGKRSHRPPCNSWFLDCSVGVYGA